MTSQCTRSIVVMFFVLLAGGLLSSVRTAGAEPENLAAKASELAKIKGYKKQFKGDPDGARKKADAIIKNTYRTLLTRGQKGCFVFCVDEETNRYFAEMARASATF